MVSRSVGRWSARAHREPPVSVFCFFFGGGGLCCVLFFLSFFFRGRPCVISLFIYWHKPWSNQPSRAKNALINPHLGPPQCARDPLSSSLWGHRVVCSCALPHQAPLCATHVGNGTWFSYQPYSKPPHFPVSTLLCDSDTFCLFVICSQGGELVESSGDGSLIAVAEDKQVSIYEVDTCQVRQTLPHADVMALAFSPKNTFVLTFARLPGPTRPKLDAVLFPPLVWCGFTW